MKPLILVPECCPWLILGAAAGAALATAVLYLACCAHCDAHSKSKWPVLGFWALILVLMLVAYCLGQAVILQNGGKV